jgi:2-hydroxychromene-2-carboxylate isomerase
MADLHFYFDPVCPFAWMTSRWIHEVARQREYEVDWRFISLRIINRHIDYDSHFPPEYEAGHTAGLRLLRVASAVRDTHGRSAVGDLYTALGTQVWDVEREGSAENQAFLGSAEFVSPILTALGLDPGLVGALDNEAHDAVIEAESNEALALTGKDVGTPIIHFEPPDGVAFFGPVISRLPSDDQAADLWDHVISLARFPGFAEMKRSLRELPQLRALGVTSEGSGRVEDWHQGSRRQKR